MTFVLGQRSLVFAAHVDPKLMAVVRLAISHSAIDFGCTENQSRTAAEQAEKVRQGVSQVTGKQARHMIQPDGFSKAIDLVPWVDGAFTYGDNQWSVMINGVRRYVFFEIAAAMRDAAVELGTTLRWGACWDRRLNDITSGWRAMKAAEEGYLARRRAAGHQRSLLDGPHFELPL